jgi:hypothetical protein
MNHPTFPRLILLALPLCAPFAWGAIGACTGGVTLSNYQPTDLQSGCAYVDKSFSNFAVNSGVGSTVGTPGTITVTSNSALGDALTSTSGLGVADFTSPAWTQTNSLNGSENQTDVDYVVQAYTGGTVGGYTYSNGVNGYVTPGANPWAISSLTLDLSNVTTSGPFEGATINMTEYFCLSSTAGNAITCPSAQQGRMTTLLESNGTGGTVYITFDCVAPGGVTSIGCDTNNFSADANGDVITYTIPGAGTQAISIYDNLDLFAHTGSTITLNSLINDFGEESEVPEPSSLLLTGLGAIGLLLFLGGRRANG